MRKLKGKDLFVVARIVKKARLKDTLAQITLEEKDMKKLGINIMFTIIEACGEQGIDEEVFKWLNDILEVKNTSEMDLFELLELVKQLFKENDMKHFLSTVGLSI